MTKAEQRALKKYPNRKAAYYPSAEMYLEEKIRLVDKRYSFIEGYRQAVQDFALTPEDVADIFNKVRELQVKYNSTEGCYAEVAEWFYNLKEEKK